ncbi:FecR family protein [Chitinophaga sp. Cy-1792]|uniref:FecR family protein n=1 Tax=Chitinophaga sp. Cy-1792 TaxID=2608339 RepID=UPI00141FB2F8|nr:FecR family protein [Chitinophaga sp. Cy-1792]
MENDELIALFEKYLAGTASPEEVQLVEAWLEDKQSDEPLFEEEQGTAALQFKDEAKVTLMATLEGASASANTSGRKILYLRWMAAAMTTGVFLAVSAWFYKRLPVKHSAENVPVVMATSAAAKPATGLLCLSHGRKIALDTVAVHTVIRDGNVSITKTAAYEIAYALTGNTDDTTMHTLNLPQAARYTVVLQDGSKVWLNAMSSITFPAAFTKEVRTVAMSGEAYFEVAKKMYQGKRQPFTVQAGKVNVAVLGTHFNINAYNNEAAVKTTLLEGSVMVKVNNKSQLIRPGQQASASHNGNLTVIQPDLETIMAWQKGYLQFNDTPLDEVFRQIARWYNVEVEFKGKINQGTFHAKIYPDMQLSDILKALKANGARFNVSGNKIIVE